MSTAMTLRMSREHAKSIAKSAWGRGNCKEVRTNVPGAFYFNCSRHGGYVVDGAALTEQERQLIDEHIKPLMATATVCGDETDFFENVKSVRSQMFHILPGFKRIEHPVYLFEQHSDFVILEKFSRVRLADFYQKSEHEKKEYNMYLDQRFDVIQARKREFTQSSSFEPSF